jgi:hypothetical protein
MSATMLQQLLQKERYETVNSSSSKCSSQELTTSYHESSQDVSFIHQSTEEIFLESHCNDLELELAALTMLFKSLGKDSLDSKGYRWNLCGAMIGDNCFDIVTNLGNDDNASLESQLEQLLWRDEHSDETEAHTIISRVISGPSKQHDLFQNSVERTGSLCKLDAISFQDKPSNKKPRTR